MTRDEAIRMLVRIKDQINFEWTDAQRKIDALNMAIESLERQRGEWLPDNNDYERMYYICSECKKATQIPRYVGGFLYDYCPNCGAEMRERKEDESIH